MKVGATVGTTLGATVVGCDVVGSKLGATDVGSCVGADVVGSNVGPSVGLATGVAAEVKKQVAMMNNIIITFDSLPPRIAFPFRKGMFVMWFSSCMN